MKKIFLVLVLIVVNSYGVSWSQMKSWMNKDVEPDVKYNLETEGYNARIYEFTPISDPGSLCIMSFTNEKMGMFCFNKSKDAVKKK